MDSIDSLRQILAKSSPRNAAIMHPPNQPKAFAPSSAPTTSSPALAIPLPHSRSTPVLQYPEVNVPSSSSKLATNVLGSSPVSAAGSNPSSSPSKSLFGNLFKSFKGRSAWDADDDEFDSRRKYSTATLKKDESTSARLAGVPHGSSSPVVQSAAVAVTDSPPDSATTPALNRLLKHGSFFMSFRGRSPFDADDDEFDLGRDYTTATLMSSPPDAIASPITNSKKTFGHTRKVSWADRIAKPLSSDAASEQSTLGSKDDAESGNTGSTLSLTSPFESGPPSPRLATTQERHLLQNTNPYKTIRKAEGKLMSASLAAARELSPYKGNMWDPEDEEWR